MCRVGVLWCVVVLGSLCRGAVVCHCVVVSCRGVRVPWCVVLSLCQGHCVGVSGCVVVSCRGVRVPWCVIVLSCCVRATVSGCRGV